MTETKTVLVVDDDAAHRATLEFILKRKNIGVITVGSGREALDHVKKRLYHFVISDIRMPDLTGLDMLHKINQLGLDQPVILITGDDSNEVAEQAVNAGAVACLTKPLEIEKLLELIS